MVAFLRGEIPLKHSIKNSLQGTRTSCEKGLGREKGKDKRCWKKTAISWVCVCVNKGLTILLKKSCSGFTSMESFHIVAQHVVEEAGVTVLDGGDE